MACDGRPRRGLGLKRLLQLWAPHQKRRVLHVVVVETGDDKVIFRADKALPLKATWSQVFAKTEVDETLGREFAERWCKQFEYEPVNPPALRR